MLRKLFPLILGLAGLGGGIGIGLVLRPVSEQDTATEEAGAPAEEAEAESEDAAEFVKLNNQFVVPVVDQGRVSAMVVLSLSLEVEIGNTESCKCCSTTPTPGASAEASPTDQTLSSCAPT